MRVAFLTGYLTTTTVFSVGPRVHILPHLPYSFQVIPNVLFKVSISKSYISDFAFNDSSFGKFAKCGHEENHGHGEKSERGGKERQGKKWVRRASEEKEFIRHKRKGEEKLRKKNKNQKFYFNEKKSENEMIKK